MSGRASWKHSYALIRQMRATRLAPVDTVGCASLADKLEAPETVRFQVLVSLLLSSQTKDEVTSAAVERLKHLPGGLNCKNMLTVDQAILEDNIKPVGFFRRKAKNLKEIAALVSTEYCGDIPKTAEELMRLPGIGPKMAHLTMQHAWDVNSGIGVDVHVHRICNRLEWVRTKEPEETRIVHGAAKCSPFSRTRSSSRSCQKTGGRRSTISWSGLARQYARQSQSAQSACCATPAPRHKPGPARPGSSLDCASSACPHSSDKSWPPAHAA